jgi:hypothetical protein
VRWEYKVSSVPTTPRDLQAHLDQDGAEEWELVSTTPLSSRLLLLFKRPHVVIQESELGQEETNISEEEVPAISETDEQAESLSEPASE